MEDMNTSPLTLRFLQEKRLLLGTLGFTEDPGRVERCANGNAVLYHYTRPEHVAQILQEDSGLRARLLVVDEAIPPTFEDCYLVEAFLEPLPKWLHASPYFTDLAATMMRAYIGTICLRIELPQDYPGLYVADFAHILECKHTAQRGRPALNLGYDCRTGHQVCRADINSYMPLSEYTGGHIAPNAKIVRRGEGIAVPSRYITLYPASF